MSVAALELNDCGLVLRWLEDDRPTGPAPDPACALLQGGELLTGRAAAARARLHPRLVHERYWADLDRSALPPPFPTGLRPADLAHAQLKRLLGLPGRSLESLVVAVPGSFTPAQLGLLLGIAASLDLRVRGLVDSAVAASSCVPAPPRGLHLDVLLHCAVLTELEGVDGELRRRRVHVLAGAGLAAVRDACVRELAATFVERTRFDPLGTAGAEQQLHDRLPELLRELAESGHARLGLEARGSTVGVDVDGPGLSRASRAPLREVLLLVREWAGSTTQAQVLLSHRAAALPGLPAALSAAGAEPVVLPEHAATTAALRQRERFEAEGPSHRLVLRLPCRGESAARAPAPRPQAAEPVLQRPTHVVFEGRAVAITDQPLALGAGPEVVPELRSGAAGVRPLHGRIIPRPDAVVLTPEDGAEGSTLLNGRPVRGSAALAAGDRIGLGVPGVELALIAVGSTGPEDRHGPPPAR